MLESFSKSGPPVATGRFLDTDTIQIHQVKLARSGAWGSASLLPSDIRLHSTHGVGIVSWALGQGPTLLGLQPGSFSLFVSQFPHL